MSPIRAFRDFGNKIGIAWWAKVETSQPSVTYWFGPFLTKRSLKLNLPSFLEDLSGEGIQSIDHRFIRCSRDEPLTI